METNFAAENLQVIRTLMERSAVYRRALAPIMLFVGTLGVIAGILGTVLHLDSMRAFSCLWLGTAALAVAGAFLIARRQAFKEGESFWSPPTRRVAQALIPPLTGGLCLSSIFILSPPPVGLGFLVPFLWLLFYGCALHAAGFFMTRGIRLFGWIFIAGGCLFMICIAIKNSAFGINPHLFMGFFFGVLHLAYGTYLRLTEKGKNVA